jgi:hypothetical protein
VGNKYKLPILHANPPLAAFVFVPSVLGENISTAEFGMISAETACWDKERKFRVKSLLGHRIRQEFAVASKLRCSRYWT